jgi:shikimate dehydrogenase
VTSPGERILVGLIGADIGSSMSPSLHEREADRHGLRYLYQLIDLTSLGLAAADVGELIGAAQRLGFRGLNITHPCKQQVLKYLDDLSTRSCSTAAGRSATTPTGTASPRGWPGSCPTSPWSGSC